MSQLMKKKFPSITSIDVGTDGNTSFLRAARNGQLDKVLEHLKSNIDINTSNANGLNALHLASKDGHVEIVEELLKRGAVVDAATKKGNTALHIASLAGQEEVVKLLVSHGASVNVQSQNGFTPLYMAAQENHDNVVKYLLANGANQSLSTEDGFTPLAVAMQQGHDKVVTVLLENDTRGKVRLPALHIAAKKDDVKAAKLLLENEHNPDVTSKSGFTPLHIASHYGNQSIANLLVQKGADVNYSAKHNITPLHVAAKWGKTNMVTVLLEQGANIESKTRDGLTPLHCAARSGHEQVVDMLLERGAPISSKTKNGLAPLHMAAQGDHVDAARILLYHRAPVDEVTVDYLTALHVAAHCGHVRVAKLLLDRQADANARALNGFTPLHIACKKNRIKVVELLLKHGASIGATTESGLTPLHVASFMGCMNIVIYLLQHDANPDVPTVRGETPLHLAARANQTDIIRILLRNEAQVDARAREQQTPLHIASRLGNVDIVMLLLQHGAKVDNTTKDMYTALHIASKEGQDEVAASLIDNGASLNATTKKGFTPLHLAAKYGHLKVAKLLLQKEAPVDAQGKNGVTPLHVASHYDHQNVALLLLEKGASPYATAKNGHTALHIAAKKNQMDIANTLLEYGAKPNAESKAGFTPLHLGAQEGHSDMSDLLIEHKADTNYKAKNGLTPLHLCAQEDKVSVAEIVVKNGAEVDAPTKNGYTPLHIASHYGQINMVRFLLASGADVKATTSLGYTPLHQAAQQGHTNIVNLLLENSADPNALTATGQTPLQIAQKLGYITVIDTLKVVTDAASPTNLSNDEKYRVVAPEAMHETFMSDSEEEGEDTVLGDQTYRYLTADEMKSLGDDSLPIDVTRDERIDSNKMASSSENIMPPRHIEDNISPEHVQQNYVEYIKKFTPDNIDIDKHPIHIGFLVSFLVDARGGAMRGCRHSGVRVIVPPRCAPSPTRITCRYVRPQRTPHPPPLMEGEALASRVLELGPVGAKFLGPVIIEVPHFAALRGKEREIVILRSDNGDSWKEHTVEATEEVLNEVLHDSFEAEDLNQMEDVASGRITRIVTQDFPQYFAVVSRVRQEVHAIGPEGGMVSSTVVPQVQAVFPQGALTKKIKVGLQAQPIDPELTAKLLGHGVAVSPVVTVEPRRRKFHKAITLSMPAPRAHSQGMINQYSGSAPTLRLLCSITGGTTRAQWEDVTGSTPLTFVNDCVSFTTTVSARFWLMDCRNVGDATKMATELYREAIHVPFMAKFVVFAKRVDPLEARLRVFCMTDDKEDKTLEHQEHFTEVAKSRDVEVLEGKPQFIEFAGNLVPITKSGEQLQFSFRAFRENRLPFSVRVKDQHAEAVSRCLFMRESKLPKGEPPQQPICILNIVLPDDIVVDTISLTDSDSVKKHQMFASENFDYYRPDPRLADMSNLLGDDWVQLATQLGLTTSEINVIKSEYPDSVAKQAQSMLRMWLSQSGNKAQANTLESALRRIGREDIIPQCLNVDYPGHGINKEIGKQRLKKNISLEQNQFEREIIKDASVETTTATTTTTTTTKPEKELDRDEKKHHDDDTTTTTFDKYSAEEKAIVQETSDEEDFNKTVTERRHQIEERLSVDRTVPASSQRVEIVQEITSIKRQSLVENKRAEVEQKVATVETVEEPVKTTTTTPPTTTTISTSATKTVIDEEADNEEKLKREARRDSELLEGVTQRFETTTKKSITKIVSTEDPKSPKFSKTPPPSPADFIMKEQAASIQEWDVAKKSPPTEKSPIAEDAEQQGLSTTTERLVASNEEKLLDKPLGQQPLNGLSDIDDNLVIDLEPTLDQTNAFIQSESQPEPHDDLLAEKHVTDKKPPIVDRKSDDNKNNINEKKKAKKGFFGSIKTFVEKSFESDSDSEKSPKKSKKSKKDKKKKSKDDDDSTSSAPARKPKLPTPPLEPHDLENIPYAEASPSDLPPPYKPPDIPQESLPVTDLDAEAVEVKQEVVVEEPPRPTSPKKKVKSKTIVIEEITKKIEPLVIESEEFTIVVDPTKQESPKKSKETFTINIDESIEKIEKEILEKSPILSEEKIVKPLADLDLSSDMPPVKPLRLRQNIYEDIEEPVLSPLPDHFNSIPEKFEKVREQRRVSYKEEPEEIIDKVYREEEKEIVEKQDKELSKEKKGGFFGLFKKRDSKDSSVEKKTLSTTVLKSMEDSDAFLKDEVDNYHDVRPVIVSEEKIEPEPKEVKEEAKEVKEEIQSEEEKTQSGGFFGLFKKSKKDEEIVEEKQTEKEPDVSEIKPEEVEKTELEKASEQTQESKQSGGLFGMFKKSKKDEPETKPVLLSDVTLKHMEDTTQFLNDEVNNYEDVKIVKTSVPETLPEEVKADEVEKVIAETKDLVKAVEEKPIESVVETSESSGFFGFFKKTKKEDEKTEKQPEIVEKTTVETTVEQVQVSTQETKKPEDEVTIQTSISRESSPKPAGFFGLFKKSKKDEGAPEPKPAIPEAALREIDDTNQFILSEVKNYHDVRPIKFDSVEQYEETIDLTKPTSTTIVDIDVQESKAPITEIYSQPTEEKMVTEEVVERSPKPSRGLFSMFRKSKDDSQETQVSLSDVVLKEMNDTNQFLVSEVQNYHDVKPEKFEPIKELKEVKTEEQAVESSPKPSRGFFSSLFKKSKEDSVEAQLQISETTLKQMNETDQFLVDEVQNYEDVKPVTETKVVKNVEETIVESSPKSSRGLFGLLKKSKDQPSGSPQPVSETVLKEMNDTKQFLVDEVEKYHDVKPEKFEEVVVSKLVEEPVEVSAKQSKGLFGLFKKSKEDSVEAKPALSETAVKEMDDTKEFLHGEVERFEDVKPEAFEKVADIDIEPKISKTDDKEVEASPKPSRGIFGIFKKSKKDEDDQTDTKGTLSETVLKDMHDSNEFLNKEKEKYHDVMPTIVISEHPPPKVESSGFLSLFKKSKKDEEEPQEIYPYVYEIPETLQKETKMKEESSAKVEQDGQEPKTGFLAKFKITKKRPTSQEQQISEETLKHMVDTGNFLKNELENYEDGVLVVDKKEEKVVTFQEPEKETSLPPLTVVEVELPQLELVQESKNVITEVTKVEPEIEETIDEKVDLVAEEVAEKVTESKVEAESEVKKSKKDKHGKDKKGFFNIFGKKSKSQDAAQDLKRDEEIETKQKQKRRKSSSPFKFFEKSKKSEDETKEKDQEELEEKVPEVDLETKDDILTIEFDEQPSLAEEVLSSLDKKMEKLKNNYSVETLKKMHDCRDFLFIEVDNYEDAKPVVVTDIDKDLEEVSKLTATQTVDEIIDLATTTLTEELKPLPELRPENIKATEIEPVLPAEPEPTKTKKTGFFSKIGNFISGAADETVTELKKGKQSAEKQLELAKDEASRKSTEIAEASKQKADELTKVKDNVVDETTKLTNDVGKAIEQKINSAKGVAEEKSKDLAAAKDSIVDSVTQKITDVQTTLKEKSDETVAAKDSAVKSATEKCDEFQTSLQQQVESVQEKSKETVDTLSEKATEIKVSSEQKAKELQSTLAKKSDKLSKAKTGLIDSAAQKLEDSKSVASQKFEQKSDELSKAKSEIINGAAQKSEEFSKAKNQIIDDASQKLQDTKLAAAQKIYEKSDELSKVKTEIIDSAAQKLDDVKTAAAQKTEELSKAKSEIIDETAQKLQDAKLAAAQKIDQKSDELSKIKSEIIGSAAQKLDDVKSAAAQKTEELSKVKSEIIDEAAQKLQDAKLSAAQKIDKKSDDLSKAKSEIIGSAAQKLDDIKSAAAQKTEELSKAKSEIIDEAAQKLQDAKLTAAQKIDKKSDDLSKAKSEIIGSAAQKLDDVKSAAAQKTEELSKAKSEIIASASEKLEDAKASGTEKIGAVKKSAEKSIQLTSQKLEDVKKSTAEKTENFVVQTSEKITEKVHDASAKKQEIIDATSKKIDDGKQIAKDGVDKLTKTNDNALDFASSKVEESKQVTQGKIQTVIDTKDNLISASAQKVEDVKLTLNEKLESAKDSAVETKKSAEQKVDYAKSAVHEKMESTKSKASEQVGAMKQSVEQTAKDLNAARDSGIALVSQKVADSKKLTEEKIDSATKEKDKLLESSLQKIHQAKETVSEKVEKTKSNVSDAKDDIDKSIKNNVDAGSQKLQNVFSVATDKVATKKDELTKTATEKSNEISSQLHDSISVAKTNLQDLKQDADRKLDTLTKTKDNLSGSIEQTVQKRKESAQMKSADVSDKVSQKIDAIKATSSEKIGEKLADGLTEMKLVQDQQEVKLQQVDEELAKLTSSLGPIVGETSKKSKKQTQSYVTAPTRRAISQKYTSDQRPTVIEVARMQSEEDLADEEQYTVTEPDEDDDVDSKRKPLFHLESEEDETVDVVAKPRERSDSVKSNVLETLTENKLDNLFTTLESEVTQNLQQTVTESKEVKDTVVAETVAQAEETLETLKKDSQADVDQIEKKLRDLDKALESLEQASDDPKLERKLHRVERKFERMASEAMEDKDTCEVSPTQVEAHREHEFQRLVSQLSTEEVSDFQKEYSHLWDETTFSKSDEWDSKTPDSQVDVLELPQGEVVYLGPVTLNKDNLVNKAGIEVDVIPIMKSPCHSPKPTKKNKRAKSAMDFYDGRNSARSLSTREFDRGSLPDLKAAPLKTSLVHTILQMNPDRFLYGSASSLKSTASSSTATVTSELSKGEIMSAVLDWLEKSSPTSQSPIDTASLASSSSSLSQTKPNIPTIRISGGKSKKHKANSEDRFRKDVRGEDSGVASSTGQHDSSSLKVEGEESASGSTETVEKSSKSVSDQHQLSDEMKELLKELEKESKQ